MSRQVSKYLFGIDLDGTLLNPLGEVADRTKQAIHAVLKDGHRVAFATGRNFIEARPVFESVAHHDLAVLVSGAVVCDTRTGDWLKHSPMNATLAGELCETIEATGHAAVAFQDRSVAGFDYMISQGREVHPSLRVWFTMAGLLTVYRPDMGKQDHSKTIRISTVTEVEVAKQIRSAVEKRFVGRAYLHGILVPHDGVEILEMFDPNVNKWEGLKYVADVHGIATQNIICVGDDSNDLPMLRAATLSLAMGNARAEVKQAAKHVIGTNADDGLAVFLEQWLSGPTRFA